MMFEFKKKKRDIKKVILKSGLFDKLLYVREYRDARLSNLSPIDHYCQIGIKEDRKINLTFDATWYREHYADVKLDGADPIIHYILHGKKEDRFINEKEKNEYERLLNNGLFDKEYYKNRYEDLSIQDDNFDYLLHYIRNGKLEGRRAKEGTSEIEASTIVKKETEANSQPAIGVDKYLSAQELLEYQLIHSYNMEWESYKAGDSSELISNDPIIDYIKSWQTQETKISAFFDTQFYLDIYPDIREVGVNPLLHFLTQGMEEGRKGFFDEEKINSGKQNYNPKKETIIFVSHESSASGAPLLGYNIADKLIQKYNVVHIVIRQCNIHESFLENCDLMLSGIETDTSNYAYVFIKQLQQKRAIKCVVCNSVVTSSVLHAAYSLNIPTVLLIHEFTDYVKPAATVMNAVIQADKVIVPAIIIQDSIQEEFIKYSNNKTIPSNIHIFPQGKLAYIPEGYGDNDNIDDLYRKLQIESSENVKIVVGSGWVQIRKGVDLFIATAKQIKENYNGCCKFVWVGDGFKPEEDLAYSIWLQREIKYSGLDGDFIFLEHQKNLDTIFSISDVFCLTSRMDPFPNVVIDALNYDLHIACFHNASGSSEFLENNNANCSIVDYVDTNKLAQAVTHYLESGETKKGINQNLVSKQLDFDNYIEQIDELITQACSFKNESQQIVNELIQSGEFKGDYFGGEGSEEKRCKSYVETSLKGIQLQNPKPGFSQEKWRYQYAKGVSNIVPLYEALKQKKTTTHISQQVPIEKSKKIKFHYAVHLHLFYVDLADEFAQYFKNLPGKFDILITLVNEEDRGLAKKSFSNCGASKVIIKLVNNIGRDSGPLFFGLKEEILTRNYKVIGHFHSKKSFDIENDIGNQWRRFLTETLIGDKDTAKSILSLFNDSKLGLVFPDDNHVVDMGENKEYLDKLCDMINLPYIEETSVFPVGNMFWARVDAIKELFLLDPDSILQEEPLPYDGSFMHAIERITPSLVRHNKYIDMTVYKAGVKW